MKELILANERIFLHIGIRPESESFEEHGKEHAKLLHPPISPATGNNMVLLDIHYIVLKKIS
jgi:hypothetical protein